MKKEKQLVANLLQGIETKITFSTFVKMDPPFVKMVDKKLCFRVKNNLRNKEEEEGLK